MGKDRNAIKGDAEEKEVFSDYFYLPFAKKQRNANSRRQTFSTSTGTKKKVKK